jgi:topoisomerase-4 subunit B
MRPGMYIGKLGDGSSPDDGIYILLKEVLDNCIDEFVMGSGKTIEVTIKDKTVSVRDYGRGIPLGKVVDVVSKMNTGGKYDCWSKWCRNKGSKCTFRLFSCRICS